MRTLDTTLLNRIQQSVAGYANIPLAAVQPVPHKPVLIAHDRVRVGRTLFKIVGKGRTIAIVWEEDVERVCWVMEHNLTFLANTA